MQFYKTNYKEETRKSRKNIKIKNQKEDTFNPIKPSKVNEEKKIPDQKSILDLECVFFPMSVVQ